MPVLLVTRPQPEARAFARALGYRPAVISPLQRIEPLRVELPEGVAGVVFTSPRAPGAAAALALTGGLTAWCTGDRTAEAARAAGFDARSAGGEVEALLRLILSERPGGPLLHLRGEHARGALAERLTREGVACAERVVYRQVPVPPSAEALGVLSGRAPVVAPLFSPRSADLLAGAGPFAAPLHVVAMSDAVAEAARPLRARSLNMAARPDAEAMEAATRSALDAAK